MKNALKNLVTLVALLVLSVALAAPAANAQSSEEGYVPPGPNTLERVDGGGSGGGQLPFTGLDVALIGIAGGSLLVLGFGMRRLTRAPDAA